MMIRAAEELAHVFEAVDTARLATLDDDRVARFARPETPSEIREAFLQARRAREAKQGQGASRIP